MDGWMDSHGCRHDSLVTYHPWKLTAKAPWKGIIFKGISFSNHQFSDMLVFQGCRYFGAEKLTANVNLSLSTWGVKQKNNIAKSLKEIGRGKVQPMNMVNGNMLGHVRKTLKNPMWCFWMCWYFIWGSRIFERHPWPSHLGNVKSQKLPNLRFCRKDFGRKNLMQTRFFTKFHEWWSSRAMWQKLTFLR